MEAIISKAPQSVKKHLADFLTYNEDPKLENELVALVDAGNTDELEKRLNKRLEFGTAGLRGPMGAGFSRMNTVTVVQAAQGLFKYLEATIGIDELRQKSIALGFDGRYNSREFAHATGAIFAYHGVTPLIFSKLVPTPFVAWAVRKLGTAAGVVVTASHNPKQDNGYKVYAGNGSQIIPPLDIDIADQINANLKPWKEALALLDPTTGLLPTDKFIDLLPKSEDYFTEILSSFDQSLNEEVRSTDLQVVYTAMHGVGASQIDTLLTEKMGFQGLHHVEAQRHPDPEFPTVPFPNPEERGALDLAQQIANEKGIDLIIANDPDADRFAAAERKADGCGWHVFHGDELGVIFGASRMRQLDSEGVPRGKQIYLCSAVSSKMLGALAKKEGARYEETMTGFKWLGNCATQREAEEGLVCALAYEEAIGYAVAPCVRDKDGVSAAGHFIQLAALLKKRGKSVQDYLAELRKTYGHFVTNNYYLLAYDTLKVSECFTALRTSNASSPSQKFGAYPSKIGPFEIERIRDVTVGFDSAETGQKCAFPTIPTSQMVTIWFTNGAVVTLRTSGTEPKLKWYGEKGGNDPVKAKAELDEVVDTLINETLQPELYGFIRK